MTNNHHQSSTIIAERFIDAIAKIRAEVARVTSEQKAKVEAEAEERVSGYRKEITQLKKQIEQDSNAHAKEIAKITSDAEASIAFIDAIAKIRADVARVTSEQKAKVEAEAEEKVSGYRKEITRLKKQIKQDSNAHAEEIAKITSDAKASVAKEKARADKAAKQLAKAKAEIAKATAKEKAGTDAEEAGAETVKEVKSETSKKKDEVDTDSSDSAANAQ